MSPRVAALVVALLLPPAAGAVEVPPEGACPPYPVPGAEAEQGEDVVAPLFRPGERLRRDGLGRLRDYLPGEVWERREAFFYEGMTMEIGPCHRRYPPAKSFVEATERNDGKTRVDEDGRLHGYSGSGLPFVPSAIPDDAPDAGMRWAWSYRHRYQGAGFRGKFRILHVQRRGKHVDHYAGEMFYLPMHGIPGEKDGPDDKRFWAGGSFREPEVARGVAWRQVQTDRVDESYRASDDVFVWMPEDRRVRRAPPTAVEGLFMPSYTRGNVQGSERLTLPDGTGAPSVQLGVSEHLRIGFTGLLIRPHAWRFRLVRSQDVLAPINSVSFGYPANEERSYGPSGLSVADDRWEIRRAVVLDGMHRDESNEPRRITLYVDALTLAPLYLVTRRDRDRVMEVGIFVSRFSADDGAQPRWEGSGEGFGVLVPVAQSVAVAGDENWLRESFELRVDPPTEEERRLLTTTVGLQRGH